MTGDQLEDQYRAGVAAGQELRATEAAFQYLNDAYVEAWRLTAPTDTAGREKLWVATTILAKVQGQLRTAVSNGKVAQKQLDELRRAGEPKKRLGIF